MSNPEAFKRFISDLTAYSESMRGDQVSQSDGPGTKPEYQLTSEQFAAWPSFHESWCTGILSTRPAERERTVDAIQRVYRDGGLAVPSEFIWIESPLEADKLRIRKERKGQQTIGPLPVIQLEDKCVTRVPLSLRLPPLISRCLSERAFRDSLVGHDAEVSPGNYGMCCSARLEEEIAPRAFLLEFCRDPGSAHFEPFLTAI